MSEQKLSILLSAFVFISAAAMQFCAADAGEGKITFSVASVSTPSMKIPEEVLKPDIQLPPGTEVPYAPSSLASMCDYDLARAVAINNAAACRENIMRSRIVLSYWMRIGEAQLEALKDRKNDPFAASISNAEQYFAETMAPFSSCFSILRLNDPGNKDALQNAPENTLFVRFTFSDPVSTVRQNPIPGINTTSLGTTKLNMSAEILDTDGRIVFASSVEKSATRPNPDTPLSQKDKFSAVDRLVRRCMEQIAEDIAKAFSCKLTIAVRGPQDAGFDAASARIIVDGKQTDASKPVTVAKCPHTITGDAGERFTKPVVKVNPDADAEAVLEFMPVQ